jgi:hypothetical protein
MFAAKLPVERRIDADLIVMEAGLGEELAGFVEVSLA